MMGVSATMDGESWPGDPSGDDLFRPSLQGHHLHGAEAGRGHKGALRHIKGGRRGSREGGASVLEVWGGGGCMSRPRVADAGQQGAKARPDGTDAVRAEPRSEAEAVVQGAGSEEAEEGVAPQSEGGKDEPKAGVESVPAVADAGQRRAEAEPDEAEALGADVERERAEAELQAEAEVAASRARAKDAVAAEAAAPSEAEAENARSHAEADSVVALCSEERAVAASAGEHGGQAHAAGDRGGEEADDGCAPSMDTGTGGHMHPAAAHPPASQAPAAPDGASPEQIAMLRRCGLNRAEVMGVLEHEMVGSIDPRAPMRIIKYKAFKEHGRIPRSSDRKAVLLSEVPDDAKIGFISHRWLRPWHTKEECEKEGHEWAGMAHPDDAAATKHKLICDGMEKLAEAKGWDLERVYLWVDFAGVEQDDGELLGAGVASLRGYITLCDAILIPAPSPVPEGAANTVDMVPGGYGDRAWTRLEATSMYAVSVLKQIEAPEIWVAAGAGASFLKRFDYVLKELPSAGDVFDKKDLEYIKGHEEAFLREIKESVRRNGYIAKHDGSVNCVAFDPKDAKGDLVASGGEDGVIKLVNRQTGTVVWSVGTETEVLSLAFSRDGSMLAAGGKDRVARVWTVAAGSTPEKKSFLEGHSAEVTSVAFSPDGKTLAAASGDGIVKLSDISGDTPRQAGELGGHSRDLSGYYRPVSTVVYSPDGSTIATASFDGTVRLWDAKANKEVATLREHPGRVCSVAFSPDSKTLACASQDGTVQLWDLSGGKPERGHEKDNPDCICHLSLESECFVYNPRCQVIDSRRKGTLQHSGWVSSVAFSPDGKALASASRDGTVKLWDISGDAPVEKGTMTGHSWEVLSVAFSPDSKTLASGSKDRTVQLWHISGDTRMDKGAQKGHTDEVTSVAWSPDGECVATGSRDMSVRVWNAKTREETCCLIGHQEAVSSLVYSPDGGTIASGSWDGTVRLWDAKAMKEKGTLIGHSGAVFSVAWSPDGEMIASGSGDGTVRLWSKSEEHKGTLMGSLYVLSIEVRLKREGPLEGSRMGDMRDFMEAADQEEMQKDPSYVLSVAFSPDGRTLASAKMDGRVKLWDLSGETPVEKGTLTGHYEANPECICDHSMPRCQLNAECPVTGHSGGVKCVTFSPESNRIASASDDKMVKIWDAETREEVGSLTGTIASWQHSEAVTMELDDEAYQGGSGDAGDRTGPSGRYLVTAEGDIVYLYMVSSDGQQQGEPLACFRNPAKVDAIGCRGTSVVVGCRHGQVLFLEAPLLAFAGCRNPMRW